MEDLSAVVLAGGAGLRLRSRVPDLPKPMAPVAGRPFLEYVLDGLLACGVGRIVLAVGHRAEAIMGHFGGRYRGASLRYAVEPTPLGTGGAAARALEGEADVPILVLNGDTLVKADFQAVVHAHAEQHADFTMVVKRAAQSGRFGSVIVSGGRVRGFAEKAADGAGWINAGAYVLQPGLFARFGLEGSFSLEKDLLERHVGALAPLAFETDGYFIDIGVPEDYERAQAELPALA